MEQLTENFHLQTSDTSTTKPRTRQELKLLRAVSGLLSRTLAAYPTQTVKNDTVEIWTEDWLKIASNQTFEALQAAVERHRQHGDGFIPQATTLNGLISEMAQARRDAAARVKVKFKACEKETGTYGTPSWSKCAGGWLMFEAVTYGRDNEDGSRGAPMYDGKPQRFVKACDCLIAWRLERAMRGESK
jgi:hypothetical protein